MGLIFIRISNNFNPIASLIKGATAGVTKMVLTFSAPVTISDEDSYQHCISKGESRACL